MTLRTRMACMVILLLLGCVFAAPFYQTVSSQDQYTESTLPTLRIQWETGSTTDVEAPTSKAKPTATHQGTAHSASSEPSDTVGVSRSVAARDRTSVGGNADLSRKTRAIFSRPIPDLDMPAVRSLRVHRFTPEPAKSPKTSAQSPAGIATRTVTSEIRPPARPVATLGQAVASPSAKETAGRSEQWLGGSSSKLDALKVPRTGRRFASTEIQWHNSTAAETAAGDSLDSVPRPADVPDGFGKNQRALQVARKDSSTSKLDALNARAPLTHLRPITERRQIPTQPRNQQEHVRKTQTVLSPVSSQLASTAMRSSGIHREWESDTRRQSVGNPDRETRWHRISRFDNLSELSKKYYGTPEHALFIFEANRQSLASPDILPLGLELIIPVRTSRIQATTRQPSHSTGRPAAPVSPVEVQYGWRGAYEE